jgi:cobalt-zinc-cadmium efflux system outer membrane protein
MNISKTALALISFLAMTGCQHYRPRPLDSGAVERALAPPSAEVLRMEAGQLRHPMLEPVVIGDGEGLSPDAAAVLAVLINPNLRSMRDQRGLADAQLLQAGLLPNPQLTASFDKPVFGSVAGTVNAYGLGLSWDVQQLLTRTTRQRAASLHRQAVDLAVAWQEWQVAEAAKTAAYQLANLEEQSALVDEMDDRLRENLDLVRRALQARLVTELDLAAAETAANQAHANSLALQGQSALQRLELNRLIGLPADSPIKLKPGFSQAARFEEISPGTLLENLADRRLDLVALRRGYASQEANVRAAILAQFPRLSLGLNRARDSGNVGTVGGVATLDLPLFDRNQGGIALERATRRQLFDEYTARLFEARAEIARLLTETTKLRQEIETARAALPGLERLVSTYRRAINTGQADVLSYYTAWNSLTQKRIDVLVFQQRLAQTRIALELASGRILTTAPAAEAKKGPTK